MVLLFKCFALTIIFYDNVLDILNISRIFCCENLFSILSCVQGRETFKYLIHETRTKTHYYDSRGLKKIFIWVMLL